ncbi:Up-regulated during septation-domain-containing protein [Dactylonectria estremocensis]|uniref:Up-regulated during septation-domain-containing protein n=1 Tax=Dactylonectria estremocensis TaxID=1079267 RepID=A0A9P9J8W8_9HYPO|nr:Up-regulated during septation-domain-containing protein [Dactylonectria estremocensis]
MNGYATADTGPYDYADSRLSPSAPSPNGKTLVEGYRKDILTGFEQDPPRFNPMNPDRTQSSALVDLKDPIQVHLLTETALSDSKQYEILSQEEVDDLKKQTQSLSQRVDSTRANLTIQSKYRDAAISMARLYSPARIDGKRRSLLGRHSGDQTRAREAEAERAASERKCEELASELFNLEKRLMEPQRRLLEHTAGILQLTHKAPKKKDTTPPGQLLNGMPGSPESLYAYSRNSMDQAAEGNYFDEGPYQQFDPLDGLQTRGQPRQNPIEIPLKSPIREQNNQLRGEMDRVRDENVQLRNQTDALVRSISDMEVRLENLNGSLRDAIVRFNPAKNDDYLDPPYGMTRDMEPGDLLKSHMDYLETGLFAIQAEQEEYVRGDSGVENVSQRIESLNRHVQEILVTVDPNYPAAPRGSETDIEGQFAYLEDSMRAVDSELERALDSSHLGSMRNQDNDQVDTVLRGLWDVIQTGFANIKQQKEERRRARMEKGLDDEEGSDDEFDTAEPYTLTGFSTRVQWLYRQATTLKDQNTVLKRQIKQQRELNNKSDAEKDEELARKQEEIEESRLLVSRAEKDAMTAQEMLSDALEDLEQAREAAGASNTREEIEARNIQIHERNAQIDKHSALLQERDAQLQDRNALLQERDAQLEERNAQIAEHTSLLEQYDAKINENSALLLEREAELQERNAQINEHAMLLQQRDAKINENSTRLLECEAELQERNALINEHTALLQQRDAKINEHSMLLLEREAELQERNAQVNNHAALLQQRDTQLQEHSAQAAERNAKIAALESDLQELQSHVAMAESTSQSSRSKLADVDSTISTLRAQLEEASRSRAAAEDSVQGLQKTLDNQNAELRDKKKIMKAKEDELELLEMNFAETKTELTIAQAELDAAFGTRAERAADVAAIKTSGEIVKLQNQITRLKNELSGTVQELEDVTKETLGAEREKIELESKLDDALAMKGSLEGEVNGLRERFEEETNKSHERITRLQEELDSERLKAVPGPGGVGRVGAGASLLSEQFRSTMREERKKFQEEIKEERSRTRKLEEELSRLKRQGAGKGPLSPR